jgi:hypothetical protein
MKYQNILFIIVIIMRIANWKFWKFWKHLKNVITLFWNSRYFVMNIIMKKMRMEGISIFYHIIKTVQIMKLYLMDIHITLGTTYYIIF